MVAPLLAQELDKLEFSLPDDIAADGLERGIAIGVERPGAQGAFVKILDRQTRFEDRLAVLDPRAFDRLECDLGGFLAVDGITLGLGAVALRVLLHERPAGSAQLLWGQSAEGDVAAVVQVFGAR
jgi:hypothetical protein